MTVLNAHAPVCKGNTMRTKTKKLRGYVIFSGASLFRLPLITLMIRGRGIHGDTPGKSARGNQAKDPERYLRPAQSNRQDQKRGAGQGKGNLRPAVVLIRHSVPVR